MWKLFCISSLKALELGLFSFRNWVFNPPVIESCVYGRYGSLIHLWLNVVYHGEKGIRVIFSSCVSEPVAEKFPLFFCWCLALPPLDSLSARHAHVCGPVSRLLCDSFSVCLPIHHTCTQAWYHQKHKPCFPVLVGSAYLYIFLQTVDSDGQVSEGRLLDFCLKLQDLSASLWKISSITILSILIQELVWFLIYFGTL